MGSVTLSRCSSEATIGAAWKTQLPPQEFDAAFERGKHLDLDTVVRELCETADENAPEQESPSRPDADQGS